MIKKSVLSLVALGMLGLACHAAAAQNVDSRFYVAPMFSMAFAQSSSIEHQNDLQGAQINIGRNLGPYFAAELYAFYFNDVLLSDRLGYAANMDVVGFGFNTLFFPARDLLPIYVLVGGGIGQNDFDDTTAPGFTSNQQDAAFYDVGVGLTLPIPLGDTDVRLRAEYRYRSSNVDADGGGTYSIRNNIVSVGLQIPIGSASEAKHVARVAPEPAPEPEPVVAPVAPQDSDHDGVTAPNDQCPQTPRTTEVNANGCRAIEAEETIVLRGVTFEFNSAQLTAQAEERLGHVVSVLKASPDVTFSIAGYTGSIGSEAYNQALSERRAQSVKAYLVAHGISPTRITSVVGYGESHPIATNETAAGRAQNRRVELHVTSQ